MVDIQAAEDVVGMEGIVATIRMETITNHRAEQTLTSRAAITIRTTMDLTTIRMIVVVATTTVGTGMNAIQLLVENHMNILLVECFNPCDDNISGWI